MTNASDRSSRHSLDWHLDQPYPYLVMPDPEGGYVIRFPDLPGCMTQVETADEIAPMAEEIRTLWIETEFERGADIPLPSGSNEYSGKFLVRVPRSLHRALVEMAEREGVSLNAYVTTLLARGVGQASVVGAPAAPPALPVTTRLAHRVYAARFVGHASGAASPLFSRWAISPSARTL